MLRFHRGYCLAAIGLFALEVFIALFLHDRFIRPYAGDFLATILVYCLLRGLFGAAAGRAAGAALAISYLIEGLQYADLLTRLGWHSRLVRLVLGSHFEWGDLLAYTLGGLVALAVSEWVDGPALRASRCRTGG